MKNLLKIMFVAVAGLMLSITEASAQRFTLNSASADTLTNTDTLTYNVTLSAGYAALRVMPVVTRLSGTAAGKMYTYISDDGVNYTLTGDSLVFTNVVKNIRAAGAFTYAAKDIPYYIRWVYYSSGTTALIPKTTYVLRKYTGN